MIKVHGVVIRSRYISIFKECVNKAKTAEVITLFSLMILIISFAIFTSNLIV